MTTLLLVIIYIAFIGLGVPDSLFGTAWPAIYVEWGLPISAAGVFTALCMGCTIVSSVFSAGVINRFGTAKVTAVSTAMTAIALLGFSVSRNIWWMFLCAIPSGLGAGAVDTALNNYVALHYNASHMSFMHCFYGVGVSFSPYIMSVALGADNAWRNGYRMAFFIQMTIAIITIVTIPLWKKAHGSENGGGEEEKPRTLSFREMVKMPSLRVLWLVFFASCAIEYTSGNWSSTFLVNARGMTADAAARMVTFYYVGMAVGRFLSGVIAGKLRGWTIIKICEGIMLTAIVILALPLPAAFSAAALFLLGVGDGPIFPILTHLTPTHFGKDISQSVISSQMAVSYAGMVAMPPLFGILAQTISAGLLPYFLLTMFAIMVVFQGVFDRIRKAE